ncbi:MAG: adenosylcobinamide-GDP ribazoletransferase [Pseudomonadota bacterium]|nr:adenosylcobinamide-GDP ribazoletransferase [Pseudomonadota bacterium]
MAWLMHQVRLFFIALQFFTRVPIPAWVGFQAAWLQHASRYFPLVGLLVAVAAALVYGAAAWLWPAPVAVLLSTAASIYMTGAFHEDGLADTCDGFGGGHTRERIMEIMKDSRIGTYGAVALVVTLGLKCTTLSLLAPGQAIGALLLAHPLSRLAAVSLIRSASYARDAGKAKPMAQEMRASEFAIAAVCTLAPALVLGAFSIIGWPALGAAVAASAVAAWWLRALFVRHIGGYTGDCLGAVQQVSEVAIYLCVLAAAGHAALA